jgi:regulatory protein
MSFGPGKGSGSVHETALRMLGRRALSRRELAERLGRRGFPPTAIRAEVRRLEAAGLLDEQAVAAAVVAGTLRRGAGRRAAAAALLRRRVSREAADCALRALDSEEERAALTHALARAARRYPGFERLPEVRRKVVRYLLARGFGAGEIRTALAERTRAT